MSKPGCKGTMQAGLSEETVTDSPERQCSEKQFQFQFRITCELEK